MAYTDRELLKQQQAGALGTTAASDPIAEVGSAHTKSINFLKLGTENAATNVAELFVGVVNRKSRVKTVKYVTATNTAADTTDYVVVKVFKGTSATLLASWNSHSSAQGAIVEKTASSFSVVSNADAIIAAGTPISYEVKKYGSGKVLDVGGFTVDLEEV